MKQQEQLLTPSAWSPMKFTIFRMIWIAAIVSNIGTWMENVGESWLMTSLTHQPILIALIQSATSLPIFFLALPSGALADILNRRAYLIFLQAGMAVTAGILAAVTYWHIVTPLSLLLLTFLIGILTALYMPCWQAITPELVPKQILPAAIALNGVSMNASRVVGPALGGFIIAITGPAAVFAINAVSFLGIIFVLYQWKGETTLSTLPSERFVGAMRAGVRYVRRSPELHRIIFKSSLFFFFSSVVLALLPLFIRRELQLGANYFGILLGCLGLGAIIIVFFLPKLRQHFSNSQIIFGGFLAFGANILLLSWTKIYLLACVAMVLGGMGWLAVLSTLNTMAQLSVSSWVRARALSLYYSAFFGSMALGSLIWGIVATHFSLSLTFLFAGVGLILSAILTASIKHTESYDNTPHEMPAAPEVTKDKLNQGPVMVTVEYFIDQKDTPAFVRNMQEMRLVRLRENSFFWSLFEDTEIEGRFLECFMTDSWVEHLRQHERSSVAIRKLQTSINNFHKGEGRPKVSHYIAFMDIDKKVVQGTTVYP